MTLYVDREVEFHGAVEVTQEVNTLTAVREAYNRAIKTATDHGRGVVQVEVVLRVAPLTGTDTPAAEPSR